MDKLKEIWDKNWRQYAVWLLIVAALWVLYAVGFNQGFNPPSPPVPVFEQFEKPGATANMGWRADPEAVEAISETLRFKVFADTPAGNIQAIPDHFYQWEVYRKCDPRGPPAKNQNPIGSCVGFGTNNAIIRTMAGQIVLGNANEELKDIAEEVTYGGSRVEIGKGRLGISDSRGRNDGSVGAWAAQFVQKWGVVSRDIHGQHDLTKYDPNRCRAWGNTGVPDDLEKIAREHPVKDITRITSWEEAKKAISQGYGIAVCSDVGFNKPGTPRGYVNPGARDSRGVLPPNGNWGHCMCIDGYHTDTDGKEYGHIENSWGPNAHSGPTGWGNPSTAGFWTDAATVDRMIKTGGDTWAFSGVRGFPARESEWFVQHKNQREVDNRLAFLHHHRHRSFDPCVLLHSLSP